MSRKEPRTNDWVPRKVRAALINEDAYCTNCGRSNDGSIPFHIDHIKPHSHGGSNNIENLRPLCAPCNLKRGNKVVGDRRTWFNTHWFGEVAG